MSKRKGKAIGDATAVKSRRVTAVGIDDAPDDTNHQRPSSSSFSLSATVSHPPTPQWSTNCLSLLPTSSLTAGILSSACIFQGDIGLIESVTLKNFMCHHLLGPFQFGPNVNFIVGNNGSKNRISEFQESCCWLWLVCFYTSQSSLGDRSTLYCLIKQDNF